MRSKAKHLNAIETAAALNVEWGGEGADNDDDEEDDKKKVNEVRSTDRTYLKCINRVARQTSDDYWKN